MTKEKTQDNGRKVDNLLNKVLKNIRTIVVERGGNSGFMSNRPLSPEVQTQIDKLIDSFEKNIDSATAVYYKFGTNHGDGGDKATIIEQLGKVVVKELEGVEKLVKEWSGRNPGDVQRADILTANYRYNTEMSLYLRYVEQTSICTAVRDTYFDLGVFVNPLNFKEIAKNGSHNKIKVSGGKLNLYQDKSVDFRLQPDEIIKRVYDGKKASVIDRIKSLGLCKKYYRRYRRGNK